MGFEVFDFIDKKKLGMIPLCNSIAKKLEAQAKHEAKWRDTSDDGEVKNTAHARQGISGSCQLGINNYSISLSHGVDYGAILEEGSKPHIITPKNSKGLYWKGAPHPMKIVHHPGTEGFHTFEEVFDKNRDNIIGYVVKHWSD
ncbi:hypothetical protein [Clostridium senegalense]